MENEIQFLLYSMPDEQGKVQVIVKDGTIWCTQKAMAQLFGVGIPAISKHLKNIFEEGELQKEVVVSKLEITTQHGAIKGKTQKSQVEFYSLDAIISVGYRVNSIRATKLSASVPFVQVSAVYGSRLLTFMRSAAPTTIRALQRLAISMP